MHLTQTVAPSGQVVTTAEAKTHLYVEHDDDDVYIAGLIAAATAWCEEYTRRQFLTATWQLTMDSFPADGMIVLPRPPLTATSFAIVYNDVDGVEQTLTSADWTLNVNAFVGYVIPAYGTSWPSARGHDQDVTVTFKAGYGTAADVPEPIKQAIKLLIGHWHAHKESVVLGTISTPIQQTVDHQLGVYRVLEAA